MELSREGEGGTSERVRVEWEGEWNWRGREKKKAEIRTQVPMSGKEKSTGKITKSKHILPLRRPKLQKNCGTQKRLSNKVTEIPRLLGKVRSFTLRLKSE